MDYGEEDYDDYTYDPELIITKQIMVEDDR